MDANGRQDDALRELPRWRGGQLPDGVDINDTSAVLAMLDEDVDIEFLR